MSLNILITAASRRVPLIRAFRRALGHLGGGSVIVTDINPLSPAVYAADRAYRVRLSSEPGYVEEILTIATACSVSLVIPTIDDELTLFAAATPAFAAAGIKVAVSSPETTRLCHDKHLTCQALRARGVAAARSYLRDEIPVTPVFPLFLKPRFGRGSVDAYPVRNARELTFFLDYVAEPVVQDYLDGPEFTIDMLCDWSARPLAIVPRERLVIRAGVTDRGRTSKDPRLIELAMACAAAVPFVGPVNIQCRVVNGTPIVFEINPRFSGGIPLTIEAGADFPRQLVELGLRRRVTPTIGQFRADVWMTNYEASVFLEQSQVGLEAFPAPASASPDDAEEVA